MLQTKVSARGGTERDYYMDVSKAENAGFRAQGLALWLPELIEKIFCFMAKA